MPAQKLQIMYYPRPGAKVEVAYPHWSGEGDAVSFAFEQFVLTRPGAILAKVSIWNGEIWETVYDPDADIG